MVDDDAGEEQRDVEEISDAGKLNDGGRELLGKWKGGEEIWEPYENVAETEAIEEHPSTLGGMGNLASVYGKQSRWQRRYCTDNAPGLGDLDGRSKARPPQLALSTSSLGLGIRTAQQTAIQQADLH